MQKAFNFMAVSAFLMSGAMVVGTVMLYSRIPSLTKYYLSEIKLELTEMVLQMVPKQIEEAMPELPSKTGLPIKFP
jgi:hypothetical protein